MRIAILGAGLAGLATAWHLLQQGGEVTLFDHKGIAGEASGIATGLAHPFPGKKALRSWQTAEGMRETEALVRVAETALGRPVMAPQGIFRPAISPQQKSDFALRAEEDVEAEWKEIAWPHPLSGLWIPNGMTLYPRLYCGGLWRACEQRGATLIRESIVQIDALTGFPHIVIATGSSTLCFPACQSLPLKTNWGQTLLCRWPEPLPFSLVSQGHITPTEHPDLCLVGSTYEHTPFPDPNIAKGLLQQVARFYPPAASFEIVEIRAGKRCAPRTGYRPLCTAVAKNLWVFTGLGSRGLLYHAWLGKMLATLISRRENPIITG